MKSVNESSQELNENDLLTAEQMREITSTPEELFEQKREDIKLNFMSTMVKLAREQGRKFYAANFQREQDTSLLDAVIKDFQELGYKTITQDSIQKMGEKEVPIVTLAISWEEEKDVPQETK